MRVTDDSIAEAMREYLDTLADQGVEDSIEYFVALHKNYRGSWASAIRNIRYGLEHFSPGLVLDLGCGLGMQGYVFAKHGREVLGIDVNYDWIECGRNAAKALGVDNIEHRVGDVTEEIRELTAGAIWMHRSIGHIQYLPEYFRRAHKTLSPGGSFVFMTSNSTSRALIPGMRRGQYNTKRLTQLLNDAKFDVRDVRYQGYLTALPPKYRPKQIDSIEPKLSTVPVLKLMGGSFSMAAYAR